MRQNKKIRLLIVGMSESIHTARWISNITDQGWELHLFPSNDIGATHSLLQNITVHHSFFGKQYNNKARIRGIPVISQNIAWLFRTILKHYFSSYRARQLARLIRKIKPDLIHLMEIQAAGYLMLEAKKYLRQLCPPWILTAWGSDIYLFGRLPEHKQKIQQVLEQSAFYLCECNRDITLAKQFGFHGVTFPCFPVTGGFDLAKIQPLREIISPSQRRYIIVKGYQGWSGRALVALQALRRCVDVLQNYTIILYAVEKSIWAQSSAVEIAAKLLAKDTGCKVEFIPCGTPYEKLLEYFAKSRVYLGLSISDGISVSMLEALVTGAFPIQSNTSCANEWIIDGVTGFIVPPEDPEDVEQAIRKALNDDILVDNATKQNWKTAKQRLDSTLIKQQTLSFYRNIISKTHTSDKGKEGK